VKPEKENCQEFWHRKCRELAPPDANGTREFEAPAKAWLVAELRKLADHIETNKGYPDVFGCRIPEKGVDYEGGFMAEWTVILSHLWGG